MKRTQAPSSLAKKAKYPGKEPFRAVKVPKGLTYKAGFPRQMKMTHKYCEQFTLTWAAGQALNVAYATWGVNCLWDPNLLVGGHQPYYFDQMVAIYNHYIVTGSRIVVELTSNSSAPYTAGVYIDDDSSPVTTVMTSIMENQSCVCKTKRQDNEPLVLRKKWDAKAAFGGNIMDNDDLQGNAAANPVETQAFIVWLGQPNVTTDVSMVGTVTIYYDTVWDELKQVTGS